MASTSPSADPVATRPTPLFLLGTPRSGTTFLQQVIDAHPEVCVTDELRAVAWLVQEAGKLREGRTVHGNPYPLTRGRVFANYLLRNADRILVPFYLREAKRAGKPAIRYWGDKYPHYDEILHLLPGLFPEARYLLIHRDLRDTIASVMTRFEWPADRAAPFVCLIYDRYVRQAEALTRDGTVPPERFLHVNYLDLNTDAAAEAGRLFAALACPTPKPPPPGCGSWPASRRTASAARGAPPRPSTSVTPPALGAGPHPRRRAGRAAGDRRDRRCRDPGQRHAAGRAVRLPATRLRRWAPAATPPGRG